MIPPWFYGHKSVKISEFLGSPLLFRRHKMSEHLPPKQSRHPKPKPHPSHPSSHLHLHLPRLQKPGQAFGFQHLLHLLLALAAHRHVVQHVPPQGAASTSDGLGDEGLVGAALGDLAVVTHGTTELVGNGAQGVATGLAGVEIMEIMEN